MPFSAAETSCARCRGGYRDCDAADAACTGVTVTDSTGSGVGGRELRLRYAATCHTCRAALPPGTRASWNPVSRSTRCLNCSSAVNDATVIDLAVDHPPKCKEASTFVEPDWGVAGGSSQRQYDRQEHRRRARLRANWRWVVAASAVGGVAGGVLTATTHSHGPLFVVLGVLLPITKCWPTPQHIAAWRSGAVGERQVGARLEALRSTGVLTIHDRRVPRRQTNIDHIAVASSGVFVIDTKNVTGKVAPTDRGLRVGGRRRDDMITAMSGQVTVVREALADQAMPDELIRPVLCFTRADLPWLRPRPGGVALLQPRGLVRLLRRPGPLSADDVKRIATVLAERLPRA